MLEPIVMKAKKYYSRVNHLFFQKPTNKTYQFNLNITFTFSARSFSGVERLVRFDVNMSENILFPDQSAANEISN